MKTADLSGKWKSEYGYHADSISEHDILLSATADNTVEGFGSATDGSTLKLKLEYDAVNNVLTGTWQEITSPTGEYEGASFHGAVQFILSEDMNTTIDGMWVGFNSKKSKVSTGKWSLIRDQQRIN